MADREAVIRLWNREGMLRVRVRDDGCGGADFSRGSGLTELKHRVETFGGRISLRSPPGAGTVLEIALPLDDPDGEARVWSYAG